MSRYDNIIYRITLAATFIILEVAALAMLKHNNALQDTWIARVSHAFMATVWGKSESIRDYFSLRRENEELVRQNHELNMMLKQYQQKSTWSLQDSYNLSEGTAGNFHFTPASIMKISNNSQHNYLILNKGANDGIEPMSGIVTEKGAIGIIHAVSPQYAYGITFTNTEMAVSSRIGKRGNVGTLIWDGLHSDGAILKEIPQHINVNEGDTLYTSGYSAIFPADIPVGITGSKKVVNGSFYEIQVRLFEDFARIKNVMIVKNIDKEEIEELEKE